MKLRKFRTNPYGLRRWFSRAIIVSAAISLVLFIVLHMGVNAFLSHRYASKKLVERRTKSMVEDLQDFITENNIGRDNLDLLIDWEYKQPVVLMEFYSNNVCIYSSVSPDGDLDKVLMNNGEKTYELTLRDEKVQALVYSDFSFQHYTLAMIVEGALCFMVFIILFTQRTSELITYICRLTDDVQILEGGNLDYEVSVQGNNELTDLAISMNSMRRAFQTQAEQEAALHESNSRLITEMSHDLRTPLTGLLLYTEILRYHRYESDSQLQEYLEKIETKAHQLKRLSDNLFEYSLDHDSRKNLNTSTANSMEQAVKKLAEDTKSYLEESGFTVETDFEWQKCMVQYNKEFVMRIGDNICSNIIKYAEKNAPVYIETVYSDKYAGISVLNTISGNASAVGTRIGLDSIRAMMREMNGICNVEQTEASFEITVLFLKA